MKKDIGFKLVECSRPERGTITILDQSVKITVYLLLVEELDRPPVYQSIMMLQDVVQDPKMKQGFKLFILGYSLKVPNSHYI